MIWKRSNFFFPRMCKLPSSRIKFKLSFLEGNSMEMSLVKVKILKMKNLVSIAMKNLFK